MRDQTNTGAGFGARIGGLYLEFVILAFCAAIFSQTGKSTGPEFDVVGSDFLPLMVAGCVAALTVIQTVRQLLGDAGSAMPAGAADQQAGLSGTMRALIFCIATVIYVALLSHDVMAFWLATVIYILGATLLLSRPITRRDIVAGALVGLGIGVGLQLIFTKLRDNDLPV